MHLNKRILDSETDQSQPAVQSGFRHLVLGSGEHKAEELVGGGSCPRAGEATAECSSPGVNIESSSAEVG